MKIKEVIIKTKLTDKAIRLYIDNGLVAPNIDESYSGRKSIEFTNDDVERLNNIALLRKAGFSIADIKDIIESDEKAQNVVDRFIRDTEDNIHHETEIIEKLKNIPAENGISLKTICESLSDSVEERQVPKEDLWLSSLIKFLNRFFAVLGNLGIVIPLAVFIMIFLVFKNSCKFFRFDVDIFSLSALVLYIIGCFGGWIIAIILSAFLLHMNQANKAPNGNSIIKSLPLTAVIVIIMVISTHTSVVGVMFLPVESYTENLNDYLELDTFVEENYGNEIRSIFPYRIPNTAKDQNEQNYLETTKYYYKYEHSLDPQINIVAEWKLSPYEFAVSKRKASEKEHYSIQKGDWTCFYYNDSYSTEEKHKNSWQDENYHFLIFAYNENEKKVRYIASYVAGDSGEGPYYLGLDW